MIAEALERVVVTWSTNVWPTVTLPRAGSQIAQASPNVSSVLKTRRRRKMIGQIFSMDRRKCAITQLETDLPGKLLTSYSGQLRPYLAF
jgi:hypothetical protein